MQILNAFDWPEGLGSYANAHFFAALTDADITRIEATIGSWEFGYGE